MISIIAAVAQNGVIGGGNQLLWHISEDLKRFKSITTGHPVIMGRKTFESLGRPLPSRINVVITRNTEYEAEGCTVVSSLDEALALFSADEEVFIIGGGEIYKQVMPLADRMYLTIVFHDYQGDTYFPNVDPAVWRRVHSEYHSHGSTFTHPFEYIDYEKI